MSLKNRVALSPAPARGAVLAVYKTFVGEERLGLARVERTTRSGQLQLIRFGSVRFDASGREIGAKGAVVLHVRWPNAEDRADHRRKFITNALLQHPWGRVNDEIREQIWALLKIEVTEP